MSTKTNKSTDIPLPVVNLIDKNEISDDIYEQEDSKIITEIRFEYETEGPIIAPIDKDKFENLSDIAKLQRQCSELSDMIKFLETGNLPEDDKVARKINFDKENYRLGQHGELIHQWWPRTKGVPRTDNDRTTGTPQNFKGRCTFIIP